MLPAPVAIRKVNREDRKSEKNEIFDNGPDCPPLIPQHQKKKSREEEAGVQLRKEHEARSQPGLEIPSLQDEVKTEAGEGGHRDIHIKKGAETHHHGHRGDEKGRHPSLFFTVPFPGQKGGDPDENDEEEDMINLGHGLRNAARDLPKEG